MGLTKILYDSAGSANSNSKMAAIKPVVTRFRNEFYFSTLVCRHKSRVHVQILMLSGMYLRTQSYKSWLRVCNKKVMSKKVPMGNLTNGTS